MTPKRAKALRTLAARLAEEERSGNGVDRSQGYGTWDTEHRERFERDLAAAAAPAHSG
jgi:hypothetical protein